MELRVEKLEQEIVVIRNDLSDTRARLLVAENNIKDIKDDITSIKSDTSWLRKAFVNAALTLTVGLTVSIIGGVIVWALTK